MRDDISRQSYFATPPQQVLNIGQQALDGLVDSQPSRVAKASEIDHVDHELVLSEVLSHLGKKSVPVCNHQCSRRSRG